MKKILAILLLAFVFISCSDNAEKENFTESDYSIKDTTENLSTFALLSDTILYTPDGENVLDGDYFDYYFGNSELLEKISDYAYFTSATTAVCEVGIFKVKDNDTKEALLLAIEERKENLISTYENYSPEDVEIAKGLLKGSFDDIVYFAMTTENDSVKSAIEK